jgi:hypothetical protein
VDKSTAKMIDIIELADPVMALGLNGRIGRIQKTEEKNLWFMN